MKTKCGELAFGRLYIYHQKKEQKGGFRFFPIFLMDLKGMQIRLAKHLIER